MKTSLFLHAVVCGSLKVSLPEPVTAEGLISLVLPDSRYHLPVRPPEQTPAQITTFLHAPDAGRHLPFVMQPTMC